jgi:hypothetical protein
MLRPCIYLLLILVSGNLLISDNIIQFPSANEITCGKCHIIVSNLQKNFKKFKQEFDVINSNMFQLCSNFKNILNIDCNLTAKEMEFLYDEFYKKYHTPYAVCFGLNLCK